MTDEIKLDTVEDTVQLDGGTEVHLHPGGMTVQALPSGETVTLSYEDIDELKGMADEQRE